VVWVEHMLWLWLQVYRKISEVSCLPVTQWSMWGRLLAKSGEWELQ